MVTDRRTEQQQPQGLQTDEQNNDNSKGYRQTNGATPIITMVADRRTEQQQQQRQRQQQQQQGLQTDERNNSNNNDGYRQTNGTTTDIAQSRMVSPFLSSL